MNWELTLAKMYLHLLEFMCMYLKVCSEPKNAVKMLNDKAKHASWRANS